RPAGPRGAVPAAHPLLPRLPPAPPRRPRAERAATDHPAEPVVAAPPGRAPPCRDPRRNLRAGPPPGPRRLGRLNALAPTGERAAGGWGRGATLGPLDRLPAARRCAAEN